MWGMGGFSTAYMLAAWMLGITFVIGSIVAVVLWVKALLRRAGERLDALLGEPIRLRDPMANFFGLESIGPVQVRGNGSLGLDRDTLAFVLAMGRREPLVIPRANIRKLETRRMHLGKSVGRDLLTVHYVNAAGQPDVAAWYVRDVERWLAELRPTS
jgi:hypothetical protein